MAAGLGQSKTVLKKLLKHLSIYQETSPISILPSVKGPICAVSTSSLVFLVSWSNKFNAM